MCKYRERGCYADGCAYIEKGAITMTIADTIFQQLGGNRFVAMTGAKGFVGIDNGLRFHIGRNASKANRVEIKLTPMDTYEYTFIKYRPYSIRVDHKAMTVKEIPEKREIVKRFDDVYCDQLQELFTMVTGMYTRL